MVDRIDQLIKILFDKQAREDERHDAAMDIGAYNDTKALEALIEIASDIEENDIILDACGESIAEILVMRNEFKKNIIEKLTPVAKETAIMFIKAHKPSWI